MNGALPLLWRRIPERYTLIGSKCKNCKGEFFPQRALCPTCRSHGAITAHPMPTEGQVFSYTEVHTAPSGFEHETPYYLAIIELANGVKLLSQVVDVPENTMTIGLPVKMVFRKISQDAHEGVIAYGYKFAPKPDSSQPSTKQAAVSAPRRRK